MEIPRNVNQIEFVKLAKKKGIKISSRYKGVSISRISSKHPKWRAKYSDIALGDFPLNEEGEITAYHTYLSYLVCNNKTSI